MSRDHYSPIKRTILTCMILVPVIPFVLILMMDFYHFKVSIETSTKRHIQRIARDHREIIEAFLRERISDLEFIHASYPFETLSRPQVLGEVFARLQLASNAYTDLGVFNEAGVHVAYRGPYPLTDKIYKDESWFKEVNKQGVYISDVFMGFRKSPHFVVAVARDSDQGRWVLRATIDSQTFNRLVSGIEIGGTGEAYITNLNGVLQTTRRSGGQPLDSPGLDPDQGEIIPLGATQNGIEMLANTFFSRNDYLYAAAPLKGGTWVLFVRQTKADAYQALRTLIQVTALVCLLGGALIVLAAFYLTHRIVGQMKKVDAEKDQLGQQLIGASRLAELGEMAAGFAHEINNPLQIIKTERAMIATVLGDLKDAGELKPSPSLTELEDSLAQIDLQTARCAKITQSILKFGRQSEPTAQSIELQTAIPELIQIIASKASVHGIAVIQHIDPGTPAVQGDPAQFQQVMINLFNNAIDAILARCGSFGGELRVSARTQGHHDVEITVRDNGCGIHPENLPKIFSPFFTTKPVGEGTGLGLSVCYGIVHGMGGSMEVASEPSSGTTFTIKLPAKKQDDQGSDRDRVADSDGDNGRHAALTAEPI